MQAPSRSPSSLFVVVFVLGGPGAGKGTQCSHFAKEYRLQHLGIGDVLRAEVNRPGSEYGGRIKKNMEEGRIGPKEITVTLSRRAMDAEVANNGSEIFLLDGQTFSFLSLSRNFVGEAVTDGDGVTRLRTRNGPSKTV